MTFNDSLIMQLGPDIRCRLNDGPAKLHDAVLKREVLLQDQIRHFINLRVDELRSYAQHVLDEYATEQRRQLQDRKDAAAARNRPVLKSIVKRRASSTNKRVSFSNVPPKVEYYPSSNDEGSEQDSQVLESSDEGEFSPPIFADHANPSSAGSIDSNSAVVVYEPSPDKPRFKAGEDFELKFQRIPNQPMPSKPRASGGYDFSKISDFHAKDSEQDEAAQHWETNREGSYPQSTDEPSDRTLEKPAMPIWPRRDRRRQASWQRPHQKNGSVSFSFDDAFDPEPHIGNDGVEMADESGSQSADILSSSSSSTERDMPSQQPPITLTVGSVPIDIHTPLTHSIDGDGGPNNFKVPRDPLLPPAAEELEVATPPSSSLNDPYVPPGELDPACLSFSRRMEWEDRFMASSSRRPGHH